MPNNIEPKWIKEIAIAVIGGGIVGKLISVLLGLLLTDEKWALFLQAWIPACIIISLIIVLNDYQKERDDTLK